MLLFSVHPEPNGRKVDKMLTLKKVKELVEAPVHTKRVPSPKMLLEEGLILMRTVHILIYHCCHAIIFMYPYNGLVVAVHKNMLD